MPKIAFDQHWWPTTVNSDDGKFHPAIQSVAVGILYWENIREATEEKAYERAGLALKDALDAAEAVANGWNLSCL